MSLESTIENIRLAGVMAQAMGGECVKLDELSAESVAGLVKNRVAGKGSKRYDN